MSGMSFRTTGSTGSTPTTVWFGGIVDRLNMLLPSTPFASNKIDSFSAAGLGNAMSVYNTSFGGGPNAVVGSFTSFTTAPDGSTTNAQLFVEATNNTMHFVAGSFDGAGPTEFGTFTYSNYLKYSGRRVILRMGFITGTAGDFSPTMFGAQAIFDLANGVVGVAMALFGSFGSNDSTQWTLFPAEMINYGSGFYRCTIKAMMFNTDGITHHPFCMTILDNGTGSAAQSANYAGDGASGAYIWKTNCMPSRAYGISTRIFNDDFNDPTLANFDKTHSRAPGFTWYLDPQTPAVNPVNQTPVSDITQSGSRITVAATAGFGGQVRIASFAPDTSVSATAPRTQPLNWNQGVANAYVGWGFTVPILFEAAYGWPVDAGTSSEWVTVWSWGIAFQMGQGHPPGFANGPAVVGLMQREMDFLDLANQLQPTIDQSEEMRPGAITIVGGGGELSGWSGFPTWSPSYGYSTNEVVFLSGTFYQCILGNTNQMPPNVTFWQVYTGLPRAHIDQTQMNVCNTLVLPYQPGDFGQYVTFLNGSLATKPGPNIAGYGFYAYGPSCLNSGDRIVQAVDGCLNSINITSGTSKATITVDRISLYK